MILAAPDRITEYTNKGCWGSRTLLDDFKQHVRNRPDATAIVDPINKEALMGTKPERVRYADFDRAVEATASALRAEGLQKDDIIMVQLPNCWELAMLYLAIARAGGVISPMPMQWRSKEITYVAEITQAKAMITVKEFHGFAHQAMAEEVRQKVPSLKKIFTYEDVRRMMEEKPDPALERIRIDADDIFTICWTSGTEAQPKGCPLSHNNWRCQAAIALASGMQPGDVMLTAGPLVNMASVGTVYVPWLRFGGTVVLHHPFDPQLLLKQMVQERIQYTLLVPAVVNLILKHPAAQGVDLSAVRVITVGSAPPSLWSMQEFKRRWNVDIGNIWGQNEGTALVSGVQEVPDMALRVDHLPRYGAPGVEWATPMARFVQTKVVGPDGTELTEDGAVGELLYRGPNVIPGYFKRPDLNAQAFDAEGYFRTGDLFQIAQGRYLKFFERAKDIIIRGGYNISAQEVENVLLGHPAVQDVAAVGMPDENLGERTCVYVVPKPGQNVTLEDLIRYMKGQGVATYKLPERLERVEAIPRNPVGKILKKELRQDIRKKMGS
ncbi:class I adenylate-forming enzyme family protein [Desulfosoma caldarium]|uniref:Acyl-CoA synthetase (AMP-forming)/AMP-acid ligase II n=1 Tax=Desulfosoma caldarium TaxID=610254 RepID=A0A3N1ULR6_9BACT|nr:AMP-binding protein [Desulfosoma caldarium]ROQ92162.1 acyl-CoA synthetase (AMP-forming)/AMP-acid ligase II [Desulfosoma caldarium]